MTKQAPVEIICEACGKESLLMRAPKYDGFTRVGDVLTCSSCGHEFADESDVHFKHQQDSQVFTDADKSAEIKVFREDEKGRLCRYCTNYVVNPFLQWCGLHKKEVEATDSCSKFAKKPEQEPEQEEEAPKKPIF